MVRDSVCMKLPPPRVPHFAQVCSTDVTEEYLVSAECYYRRGNRKVPSEWALESAAATLTHEKAQTIVSRAAR